MENTTAASEVSSRDSIMAGSSGIKKLEIACPGCGNTRSEESRCSNCGIDLSPLIAIRRFPDTLVKQGKAAFHDGDLNRSIELFNAAIVLDPSSLENTLHLVDIYLRRQMFDEAGALLKRAESIDPDSAAVMEKKQELFRMMAGEKVEKLKRNLAVILPIVLCIALVAGVVSYLLPKKTDGKKQTVQTYPVVDLINAGLRHAGITGSCSVIIDTSENTVSFKGTVPDSLHVQIINNVARVHFPDSLIDLSKLVVRSDIKPEQKRKIVLKHRVLKGETLSLIARNFLGSSDFWEIIYQANRKTIVSNDRIYEGQTILIPLEPDMVVEVVK